MLWGFSEAVPPLPSCVHQLAAMGAGGSHHVLHHARRHARKYPGDGQDGRDEDHQKDSKHILRPVGTSSGYLSSSLPRAVRPFTLTRAARTTLLLPYSVQIASGPQVEGAVCAHGGADEDHAAFGQEETPA
jgi:hypothetical protein